jgi:hypothetical protein
MTVVTRVRRRRVEPAESGRHAPGGSRASGGALCSGRIEGSVWIGASPGAERGRALRSEGIEPIELGALRSDACLRAHRKDRNRVDSRSERIEGSGASISRSFRTELCRSGGSLRAKRECRNQRVAPSESQ